MRNNKEWKQLKRWWCCTYWVLILIISCCIGGISYKLEKQNAVQANVTSITQQNDCFDVVITYTYSIHDTTYNRTEIIEFDSSAEAQKFINTHSNSTITTYYEDDPSQTTIDPTRSIEVLFTMIFGTLLLLILVFIIGCLTLWCERKVLPLPQIESPSIRDVLSPHFSP
jgi:hypothetical protein